MQKVEYKKTIPKYEVNTFKRYGYDQISPKYYYYSNSSKNKNYFPSSEEEKTNSKSNYKISDINKTTSSRSKFNTKMRANNQFSNSQNLFNDNDIRPDSYKYKALNQENSSIKSNRAYISLNSLIQGRNSNSKTTNNIPKLDSDMKNNQNLSNHKNQNLIGGNSNDNIKENIYNKNNYKFIYNTTYKISNKDYNNLSSKIVENDSNVNNNHHMAKTGSMIQENDTNTKMILNTSRRKNYDTKAIIDYKTKNEISKTDNKKYTKNSMYKMERGENNLSMNIKRNSMNKINDFRGGYNSQNLNKKDIISIIPNTKGRNEINELKKNSIKDFRKRPDMNTIRKISLINMSNFLNNNNSNANTNNINSNTNNINNTNESSQKNIPEKTNHSFYEVKSLKKESPNQKNDSIIPKTKKIIMRLGNDNTLDLSATKKTETNLKTELSKYRLDNNRRNKNDLKERKINLSELNKCLINEGKIYLLSKGNNKANLEQMIKNDMILGNNYIKEKKDINSNLYRDRGSIRIQKLQIKKQEDIYGRNRNKIIEIINKRNNSLRARNDSLSLSKFYKFRASDIISYNLSYIPKSKEDKNNNNNNKIKGNHKKKINIFLKNLNCKTYEEDLKPDMENNKYKFRYKVKKIGRRNGNLKPQIGVRITLLNEVQPERKRYYYMNFFYSENLRNLNLSKENEFYF
jgi:hypothetical protein